MRKALERKNDGNENLSLDDNEKIEVESDAGSFVEEDWNDPEQNDGTEVDGAGSTNTTGNQDWQS